MFNSMFYSSHPLLLQPDLIWWVISRNTWHTIVSGCRDYMQGMQHSTLYVYTDTCNIGKNIYPREDGIEPANEYSLASI